MGQSVSGYTTRQMAATGTPIAQELPQLPPHLAPLRLLHSSRHAVTVEALDRRTGARRAVKRLLPARSHEDGPRRRLAAEVEALSRLGHRHIVHLHGWAECPDATRAAVLEFVDGPTLRELLMGGRVLPEADVARLGAQLGAALAHVHCAGLVHSDVKPANVLLDGDRAVLIDFHLARRPGPLTGHIGTRGFTAPEVVRADWIGKASDAWGLGALLHRARYGTLPVPDPTWWQGAARGRSVVEGVIHELLAPLPERRLGCSRAADRLSAAAVHQS
jgi:serine/threonine protein kinase